MNETSGKHCVQPVAQRYEIGLGQQVLEWAARLGVAVKIAQDHANRIGRPVALYDRMARRGQLRQRRIVPALAG